jgi:hypothetical protein
LKTADRELPEQIKKDWIHDKKIVKHLLVSKLTTDFKAAATFKIKIKQVPNS